MITLPMNGVYRTQLYRVLYKEIPSSAMAAEAAISATRSKKIQTLATILNNKFSPFTLTLNSVVVLQLFFFHKVERGGMEKMQLKNHLIDCLYA